MDQDTARRPLDTEENLDNENSRLVEIMADDHQRPALRKIQDHSVKNANAADEELGFVQDQRYGQVEGPANGGLAREDSVDDL